MNEKTNPKRTINEGNLDLLLLEESLLAHNIDSIDKYARKVLKGGRATITVKFLDNGSRTVIVNPLPKKMNSDDDLFA